MKGKLTSKEQIRENILSCYDQRYYTRVRREQLYAFGEKWDSQAALAPKHDGDLPDYGDTTPTFAETGASRRIANAQFWALTSVMQQTPKITCPDVPAVVGLVRSKYYEECYSESSSDQGDFTDDGWATEHDSAFMDGQGHGMGWVEHGMEDIPESGFQRTTCRHSPLLQTFWDRTARNPAKSRVIAFVDYIDYDIAVQIYGKDKAERAVRNTQQSSGNYTVKQCRVIRYYDRGWDGGTPTMATLLGTLDGEGVCYRRENPIGNRLPTSYYLHVLLPGMFRGIGQIAFQIPTQEMINHIERAMRQILKMPGFQGFDVSRFDPDDLQGILAGTQLRARLKSPPPGTNTPALEVFNGMEIASSLFSMYQLWDRQYSADSGQSDIDRGNTTTQDKTLGEVQLLDQRGKIAQSWAELQATKFFIRSAKTTFAFAKRYDRQPRWLDINGRNLLINDPANPVTALDQWFMEPSRILLDAASLKAVDADQEIEREAARLAMAGKFGANPAWLLKKLLEAMGEDDMAEAMAQPPAPPVDPATGQPAQPAVPV